MRILTIQTGHNATVALMQDGEILGALSQEKVDNVKNSAKFPADAIRVLCEQVGWRFQDIDAVVNAGTVVYPPDAYAYVYDMKRRATDKSRAIALAKRMEKGALGQVLPQVFLYARKRRQQELRERGIRHLVAELEKLGLGGKPLTFVDHHECHARSAFHSFSVPGDGKAGLIFTLDGAGDDLCATVTTVSPDGCFERIARTPMQASLGYVYSLTTKFLGMKVLEHEYKVMGLAPYAKSYYKDTYERVFKPVIWVSKQNGLVFESAFNLSGFYDYLVEHAVGERFDNIAGAVQHLTEELVIEWVRNAIAKTGIHRLYTGGGVFMNVKLNRRIQELPEVEEVHFMPSCGDESNPIGAAYSFAADKGIRTRPLDHLYLGVGYSDDQIEMFIAAKDLRQKYDVVRCEDIEEKIAEMVAEGEIVARFAGRCEWGARSLGNRAILAHPSYMESFYTVNDLIKSRDFWMPFAPSILDSAAGNYLENYDPAKAEAPFMITAFQASSTGIKELRAALHQGDHSLRPQVVTEEANPSYHKVIKSFERRTGVGAVLNTSFNLHGYPLVATPEQALFTLENSGLRHLALGSYLMSKRAEDNSLQAEAARALAAAASAAAPHAVSVAGT